MFLSQNFNYCKSYKYLFLPFIEHSYNLIKNSIYLFNKLSIKLIENDIDIKLIINYTDQFLFSIIKLIDKVRLLILKYI